MMKSIKEQPPRPAEESNDSLVHVPVLLDATLRALNPAKGESYCDFTAGYGGHARAFCERTENYTDAVLVDRDENAIATLGEFQRKGATLIHADFVQAAQALIRQGRTFDIILADLGVSSPQLDRAERGFSFRYDGPLDMRMNPSQERSAADVVNTASERELIRILTEYGEEPYGQARRIARGIIDNRPLSSTLELAECVRQATTYRRQKHHPATRTFQALRIEVNEELRLITELLPLLPRLLTRGGRVGIISFHSLEDRLIKRFFQEQVNAGYEAELIIPEKKPIQGTEDVHNPRSRSAKFRYAVKK